MWKANVDENFEASIGGGEGTLRGGQASQPIRNDGGRFLADPDFRMSLVTKRALCSLKRVAEGGGGGSRVVNEGQFTSQSFLNGSQLLAADITVQSHSIGEQCHDRNSFVHLPTSDRWTRTWFDLDSRNDRRDTIISSDSCNSTQLSSHVYCYRNGDDDNNPTNS